MSRPQIRPDYHEGILSVLRFLQSHPGERPRRNTQTQSSALVESSFERARLTPSSIARYRACGGEVARGPGSQFAEGSGEVGKVARFSSPSGTEAGRFEV